MATERLAQRPFFAWLRFLSLHRLDGEIGTLAPVPGHREVVAIATPQRLEPVAQELSRLRGQRTRLVMRSTEQQPMPDGGSAGQELGTPTAAPGFDRRAAIQIPLVKQVLDVFPDASLIDAREEAPDSPQAGAPDGAEAGETELLDDDMDP